MNAPRREKIGRGAAFESRRELSSFGNFGSVTNDLDNVIMLPHVRRADRLANIIAAGRRDGRTSWSCNPVPSVNHFRMDLDSLSIRQFQKHISGRYEKADRARGTPGTWLHFSEEIGELARALARDDRANLEEEFADVVAWLCTLANINDIDLAGAVARKYLSDDAPKGTK
jgi:NTP pyrophosphatase (non-canonical NTP hydrolase)